MPRPPLIFFGSGHGPLSAKRSASIIALDL
jgi:hypothetical protein